MAAALCGDEDGSRTEAAERLRSLVSKIVLTPADGKLTIDVHGDLAGILTIAKANTPSSEVTEGTDTTDRFACANTTTTAPVRERPLSRILPSK